MVSRIDDGSGPFVTPALQAAWVRELRRAYDNFNYLYAGGRLRPPLIRLGSGAERLGEWADATRTLTIAEHHILTHSWESVLETLRHEMAHQFVAEVLGAPGAPPHGEHFQQACRVLRAAPGHRAVQDDLGRLERSDSERDRMLARVKDLLQLARSPNEHEAASAMRMAHKYLLKYNLSLSDLDSRRDYEVRHLGRCAARVQEWESTLSLILQDHFFVLVIWTLSYDPFQNRAGRVLQISGTRDNCEIAEYVHRYIVNITEPLWRAHRAAQGEASGTRLQYLAGLLRGFQEKLEREQKELKEEHGLIWLGDRGLDEFFHHLHPRTRSFGSSGVERGEGYRAGVRDGRNLVIRRGIGGESTRRGRLIE
jgi:hypothetical protein